MDETFNALAVNDTLAQIGSLLGMILLVVLCLAWAVFWVMMLINAAKQSRWGWFIVMLIIEPLALLYRITDYQSPEELRDLRRAEREARKAEAEAQAAKIERLEAEVERLRTQST